MNIVILIILIGAWGIISNYLVKKSFTIKDNERTFSLKEDKIGLLRNYSNTLLFSVILLFVFYKCLLSKEWLNLFIIPFIGIIFWMNYKEIKSLKHIQEFTIDKLNKIIVFNSKKINFEEIKTLEFYEESYDSDASENYSLNLILNRNEKIQLLSFNKQVEGEDILYQISKILNIDCLHFINRGLLEPKITSYVFSSNRKNNHNKTYK
ncbi:MAG: hypothetical protein COA88_15625 [Kordia sp.]|nr:MAG: hypothetical protein COA88_15625 [Kordia sp.]